jgi:hypothetical protein
MKRVVLAVLAFAGLASAEDHCRDWNRHDWQPCLTFSHDMEGFHVVRHRDTTSKMRHAKNNPKAHALKQHSRRVP